MAQKEAMNFRRLKEEQEKALIDTDNQLEQLNKFRSDYVALRDRLKTLPNKTMHNVMVPFGSLAFMPGQLVHTNEILVLLGDNYFVERSATQAAEIVTRRLKNLDESTQGLQKQREMLTPRAQFTSDMIQMASGEGEQKEIVEEYDEEQERQWRERHREYLRRAGEKRMKERAKKKGSAKETTTEKTDSHYWDILDQLEQQERQRRELDNVEEEQYQGHQQSDLTGGREKEDSSSLEESEEMEEEAEDSSEMEEEEVLEHSRSKIITFSHTKQQDEQSSHRHTAVEGNDDTGVPISSPADLYRFIKASPKSILKPPSKSAAKQHRQDKGGLPPEDHEKKVSFGREQPGGGSGREQHAAGKETSTGNVSRQPHVQAFTDTVVEREIPAVCVQQPGDSSSTSGPVSKPEDGAASARPMSKFRASRQLKSDVGSRDSLQMDSGVCGAAAVQERDVGSARPVSRFRASRMKQEEAS